MGSGSCRDLARTGNGKCCSWAQVRSRLDWLTAATTTVGVLITATALRCKKTHNLQMYEGHFRSKMCWNASATSWKGFVGGNPEPSLSGEVRSGSSSTQHPGTSRECLVHWLQSKDNALDCPCRLQSAAQAGTESHFTFLNNSETNTQTQTYFGHSQTKSGPRRRKKRSILLTPNWIMSYHAVIESISLSDIHDLILQKLPHFLGQSPNIIFSLTLGKQD